MIYNDRFKHTVTKIQISLDNADTIEEEYEESVENLSMEKEEHKYPDNADKTKEEYDSDYDPDNVSTIEEEYEASDEDETIRMKNNNEKGRTIKPAAGQRNLKDITLKPTFRPAKFKQLQDVKGRCQILILRHIWKKTFC